MNSSKLIFRMLFISLSVLFLSCSRKHHSNNCISYNQAPVSNIEGPKSGSVNQVIDITVSFDCINGCGQFGRFEQTSKDNTTLIKVIAKYEGCVCTDNMPTLQSIYKFKAKKSGTYLLKFLQADNVYLTDTIVVK